MLPKGGDYIDDEFTRHPGMSSANEILHPRIHAQTDPHRVAIRMADSNDSLSYGELVANADRAAQLFNHLGLQQGDTIALLLENHVRYAELCWAAKNSGLHYACISSQSSLADAAYIVENSEAKLLISSARLASLAADLARTLSPLASGDKRRFLMVGETCPSAPFASYESALQEMPARPLAGRVRGPSMLYSSGTTGRPKGVRSTLSDESPEIPPRRLAMLRSRYPLDSNTVLYAPGPMYHAAPGRFMMSVLRCGGTFISCSKFDALHSLQTIERYKVNFALLVPTMMIRMVRLPETQRRTNDLSSLQCVLHLGAPCPVAIKEQIIKWWGPIVEELYGGTEAFGHTMINSEQWLAHKGSVGKPAAGCSIRIVDESGQPVKNFETGLIYMNNGHRFEYFKDPEKTRGAITEDGWGTLGDVGYLDDEGYLYLTDRASHMIISGGVNIYPQEAENLLMTHPEVSDVAVIGVAHEEFGEEVKALIVPLQFPVTDPVAMQREIIAFCRSQLSVIKCPRSVEFVDALPRNESGKLLKHLLRERFA